MQQKYAKPYLRGSTDTAISQFFALFSKSPTPLFAALRLLQHFLALEDEEHDDKRNHHQRDDDDPVPLGVARNHRERDVHSVEGCDEGRRHQKERNEGEYLHYLVLIEVDETDDRVLEILETVEAEIRVVHERGDVLEHDVQLVLDALGTFLGLEYAGNHALLVHDALAKDYRILLQAVDVEEEFLVDVLAEADLLVVLGNLLGEDLYHVGVGVDALLQNAVEHREAVGIHLRKHVETTLEFGKAAELNLAESREHVALQYEGDRLHCIFLRPWDDEVRVCEYGVLRLRET